MSFFQIPDSFRDFTQLVTPVDDGCYFPVAKSSRMMVRSSLLDFAMKPIRFLAHERDNTSAVIKRARDRIIHRPLGLRP